MSDCDSQVKPCEDRNGVLEKQADDSLSLPVSKCSLQHNENSVSIPPCNSDTNSSHAAVGASNVAADKNRSDEVASDCDASKSTAACQINPQKSESVDPSRLTDNSDSCIEAVNADGAANATNGNKKRSAVGFTIDFDIVQSVPTEKQPQGSLQDCFSRLRKQKQDLLKNQNSPWALSPAERVSPERLRKMREKFVEQAKKYIGVPYSRKYWQPDEPEYSAPLYLDCCGLVRQVIRDLRDDFGFAIGPWNQAYMWDTLPTEFPTPDQMQLGDLVFVTGTYHKGKQQKHNVTHVEIWLADGEKTLASRWWRGKVQEFDTYKFQPTSYHSHEYHFRSIEPWLLGECRSHCSEHKWLTRQLKLSRRSVFALSSGADAGADADADADGQEQEEEQDQSAENAENV